MAKCLPPPDVLHNLLRYEPDTGLLLWRSRPVSMFADGYRAASGNCANWNARHAGLEAGAIGKNGYLYVGINYGKYLAHRVIWAMVNNEWPKGQIDHINHNRTDNRIVNLRVVSGLDNSRNMSLRPSNKSGNAGVFYDKSRSKWAASITVCGKTIHLRRYHIKCDAVSARKKAEKLYNFHPNNGARK